MDARGGNGEGARHVGRGVPRLSGSLRAAARRPGRPPAWVHCMPRTKATS